MRFSLLYQVNSEAAANFGIMGPRYKQDCECCAGVKYHSATSFSIHVKRQQTPGKQGDDGWKSVLYEGAIVERSSRNPARNVHEYFQLGSRAQALVEGTISKIQGFPPQAY